MRLLLDTHMLLWLVSDDPSLPTALLQELGGHDFVISAGSIWELSIKHHLGKLPSAAPFLTDIEGITKTLGASLLPITPAHALRAGELDWAHRDPFDRVLVAQAQVEGMQLVTLDEHIRRFAGTPLFRACST